MSNQKKFSSFDYSTIREIPEQALRINLLEKRINQLIKRKSSSVLEVGLGSGEVSLMLSNQFENVISIDSDIEICRSTKKFLNEKNVENVKIIHSKIEDIENIDLNDCFFNHVILLNFLEHVENPVLILKLISKRLGKNGIIHITVPLANSLHRLLAVEMGLIKSTTEIAESDKHFGHYRIYTLELLKQHIVEAELKIDFEQSFYLKPLPTSILTSLPSEIHEGLFKMGQKIPEFASYIYIESSCL